MSRILHTVISADLLTPVAAFMRLRALCSTRDVGSQTYRLLYESVEGGKVRGRYSVIAMCPDLIWRCKKGKIDINRHALRAAGRFERDPIAALSSLRRLVADAQLQIPENFPPMIGGVFGYLGYEFVKEIEALPDTGQDDLNVPDGVLIRPTLFAVFDSLNDEVMIAVVIREDGLSEMEAETLLHDARHALQSGTNDPEDVLAHAPDLPLAPQSNMTPQKFEQCVRDAQRLIAAGDAFQVVPSQRFDVPFPLQPLSLYRALRRVNPAPFLFIMELDAFALVGSSPEILVRVRDQKVTIRPLAGTRPRGGNDIEDRALEHDLLHDEKERAEHLMLIDLGRNDVSRVAKPGTVTVPQKFVVERYSHVMHISSTVEGIMRPECDAIDALCAAFPAGTLTGAPKIRAMEIIDLLEPSRRGPYAGCLGYFGADGQMDTCIALRMAVVKDSKLFVQAGCGVVADSVPKLEEEETRHKSRAIFTAAEKALRDAWHRNPKAGATPQPRNALS